MEVELTVLERLVLLSILPKEGTFMTLKLLRKFREALSFDELELKRLKIKQEGDKVVWDMVEGAKIIKKLKVGETLSKMIKDSLTTLDKQEKLTEDHFSLYEKFVEQQKEETPLSVVPPKGKTD